MAVHDGLGLVPVLFVLYESLVAIGNQMQNDYSGMFLL